MIIYKFRQNEDYEKIIEYLGKESFVEECATLFQPIYEKKNTAIIIDLAPGKVSFIGERKNIESLIQDMNKLGARMEKLK
jgi:hypothetical protein